MLVNKKCLVLVVCFCFQAFFSFGQSVPKNGDLAPDIILPSATGTEIHLSSLRGKVVLIDFWASWCGPCRMANEETIEVYEEYKSRGFEIYSVSLDRKKEPWIRAIKDDRLPWSSHVCDFKEWNCESVMKYHVEALPATFLIDENGHIISTEVYYYDIKKIFKKHFSKIHFFPRESANQLILTNEAKYEIQTVEGKLISKGLASFIDINTLEIGDYMLKVDSRLEHFKKIEKPKETPSFTIDSLHIIFTNESSVKIYNQRGYKVIEKHQIKMMEKHLIAKGNYYIWINGEMFSLEI